jgi:anti-sigma factor RsiW
MRCRKYKRWWPAWVSQDLPEKKRMRLESHLQTCPQCSQKARDLKESLEAIQQASKAPELTEPEWSTLLQRVLASQPNRRGIRWWVPAVAFGTIAAIVIGAVLLWKPVERAGGSGKQGSGRANLDTALPGEQRLVMRLQTADPRVKIVWTFSNQIACLAERKENTK